MILNISAPPLTLLILADQGKEIFLQIGRMRIDGKQANPGHRKRLRYLARCGQICIHPHLIIRQYLELTAVEPALQCDGSFGRIIHRQFDKLTATLLDLLGRNLLEHASMVYKSIMRCQICQLG